MEYRDLVELWKRQREQYQLWEIGLTNSAGKLREKMEAALNMPSHEWIDPQTKQRNRYVELVDFFNKEKCERRSPNAGSITPQGELVFGISVTFDHGAESHPKHNLYIPVAIRFSHGHIEYALFNLKTNCPEQEWSEDSDEFCKRLIKQYADHLDHDPHSGFGRKTQIGFMRDL